MALESSFEGSIGRRWFLLLLALLAGCSDINVVRKQKLELKGASLPLRTFAFPSGLRVIVERDTRTPLAGVFLVVGSGSSSDPEGKEGLAHYVEHLAFQSRPFGAESFWDLQDKAGAITRNASTDWDATTYFEIGPASALPDLLRNEAVRMVIPVSDVPEVARKVELDVVRNELRERNETGFIGDVYSRLLAAAFPVGHPYARPVGGSHQSVAGFTKADVDAFAKAHYRPDNMTLVLLGNIDLEKAEDLLASSLPAALVAAPAPVKLPERLSPTPPAVPEPPARPEALPKFEAAISSPELWLAWVLPRGFDRDGYLLAFLASAANGQLSRARIDDHDIASVSVFPVPGKEASMLLCRVALHEGAHPEKSLEAVLGEAPKIINQFLIDPNDQAYTSIKGSQFTFADQAYSRARRSVLVGELLGLQDLVGRGVRRATVTHFSQDPALLSRALADLTELKAEKFSKYGLPYLTAARARAVLFVPAGAGAAASAKGGPAPGERAHSRVTPPPPQLVGELVASPAQLTTLKLANGLSVVLARRPGLPLVSASLQVGVSPGAAQQAAARAFAEAESRPASGFNDPSEYGGQPGSSTSEDHIVHRVQGAAGNVEAVLATLAEWVRTMRVEGRDAIYFKEYVLPNYVRREREPHLLAARDYFDALLPGNPYGHEVTLAELREATPAAAGEWVGRTHAPDNATLVLSGDFEPQEVQRFINDSFAGWKRSLPAAVFTAPASALRSEVKLLSAPRPGGSQGELRFGCQLPAAKSGAMAARHALAAHLLQDRLWAIFRDRLGASYGVHVEAAVLEGGTAYLDLGANIENGKLRAVLTELRVSLEGLAAKPAGAADLAWARYEEASSIALGQMTNDGIARSILRRTQLGFSPDPAERRRELEAVTEQELQEEFKACLAGNPTLSIVGEEAVVQAALKEGWK